LYAAATDILSEQNLGLAVNVLSQLFQWESGQGTRRIEDHAFTEIKCHVWGDHGFDQISEFSQQFGFYQARVAFVFFEFFGEWNHFYAVFQFVRVPIEGNAWVPLDVIVSNVKQLLHLFESKILGI
jgi:hypothetical protein